MAAFGLGGRLSVSPKTLNLSVGWSIVLVVLGLFAIMLPGLAGLVVARLVAWLILIAGIMHFVHAFGFKGVGGIVWELLLGVLFVLAGGYMLLHPLLSLTSLTLLLALMFLMEGVFHILNFFQNRSGAGSSWLLVDGIVTLVLGLLIWRQWPASAMWAVGLIVGIDLLMTGWTHLMLSRALKRHSATA